MLVVGYSLENSEDVDVGDDLSSCCIDSEDVALLECLDCSSFFEPGTYCPRLFE
jgi:hypothetical protein